jgi:type 1 fimbriae regulatory protein FimE
MSRVNHLAAAEQPSPKLQNGKVQSTPPLRRPNKESRSREYLTEKEMEKLMVAARSKGRWGQRDATLLLIMYHHGLRVSEAVSLRWDQIHIEGRRADMTVNRLKNGKQSTQPIPGDELRAIRQLQRDWPDSPYLFVSERGGPMTDSNVRKMVAKAGVAAKFPFPVHPHMLRHATGYKLANDGRDTRAIQDYLGHRNITHTVRYTESAPERFKGFF